jgi:putative addiction module component (TIGR02574 family)
MQSKRFGRPRGRPKYNQTMARKLDEIAAEAMQLTSDARAALAKRLLDSLETISPEEHEKLWVQEAARRYDELRSGTARAIPAEEVFAKLEKRNRG